MLRTPQLEELQTLQACPGAGDHMGEMISVSLFPKVGGSKFWIYGDRHEISLHGSGFLENRLFVFYKPDLS